MTSSVCGSTTTSHDSLLCSRWTRLIIPTAARGLCHLYINTSCCLMMLSFFLGEQSLYILRATRIGEVWPASKTPPHVVFYVNRQTGSFLTCFNSPERRQFYRVCSPDRHIPATVPWQLLSHGGSGVRWSKRCCWLMLHFTLHLLRHSIRQE